MTTAFGYRNDKTNRLGQASCRCLAPADFLRGSGRDKRSQPALARVLLTSFASPGLSASIPVLGRGRYSARAGDAQQGQTTEATRALARQTATDGLLAVTVDAAGTINERSHLCRPWGSLRAVCLMSLCTIIDAIRQLSRGLA